MVGQRGEVDMEVLCIRTADNVRIWFTDNSLQKGCLIETFSAFAAWWPKDVAVTSCTHFKA